MTCHDTIGPVALSAATHLMLHIPNALIMEAVRGYVDGWYFVRSVEPPLIQRSTLSSKGEGTAPYVLDLSRMTTLP